MQAPELIALAVGLALLAGCQTADSLDRGGAGMASARSDQAGSLVGRWEPIVKSSGGICAVLDLLEDGTFVSGLAVQVDLKYSLEGSRLSLLQGEKVLEFEFPWDVAFVGQRMTIPGEPARTRLGAAVTGASPIVGVWTYEHHTGPTAYERYEADGTCQLRIPMLGETRGRWKVAGGVLTLETNGTLEVSSFEMEMTGDLLTITNKAAAARPRTLRRTSAWYEFPLSAEESAKVRERALRRR
jgi:hypothetical protein